MATNYTRSPHDLPVRLHIAAGSAGFSLVRDVLMVLVLRVLINVSVAELHGENKPFARKDLARSRNSLAERSKAVAQGAIPDGRELEPHSCHFFCRSLTCVQTNTHLGFGGLGSGLLRTLGGVA